jgi:hypothetical protein
MFARTSLVALALMSLGLSAGAVTPALAAAQGFEYAPGTGQYRITQTTKVAQEAMGQKQEFESSSNQLLTITLARQNKDTLAMTAVIDSVSQTGPMGPTPGLEKLIGVKADAKLSPAGVTYSVFTKDSAVTGAAAIADGLGRFLPKIRARLVKGATWVDTTIGKVKQAGLDVDRQTISKFAVVGDTTVAGEKSWKLTREDSTSMSGSGMAQGQAMTMEGTSIGKGAVFVSQKGTFVRAEGGEQSTVKLVLSANGLEINVVSNANTKIEKVK